MKFKGIAKTIPKPTSTRNLFGSVNDIADRAMLVLDRNEDGDCLCLEPRGKYLVDVDHVDIESFTPGGLA